MSQATIRYASMAAFSGFVFQFAASILDGWYGPPLIDRPVAVAAVIAIVIFLIGAGLIHGSNQSERP